MKYVQTFENFSNSGSEAPIPKLTAEQESKIKEEISQKDPEELNSELMKLSSTIGISIEEMKDPKKVYQAMEKAGMLDKLGSQLQECLINENWFTDGIKAVGDWLKSKKNAFFNILAKTGVWSFWPSISLLFYGLSSANYDPAGISKFGAAESFDKAALVGGAIATVVSIAAAAIGSAGSKSGYGKAVKEFPTSKMSWRDTRSAFK